MDHKNKKFIADFNNNTIKQQHNLHIPYIIWFFHTVYNFTISKSNPEHIKPKFLTAVAAYPVLPKESAGMNVAQKNEAYIHPMYERFTENFEKIQSQIKAGNVDAKRIDLISYKIESIDPNASEASSKTILPQAMSLFFNYKKKEHVIPISVVQIDEQWYILEILFVTDLFKE